MKWALTDMFWSQLADFGLSRVLETHATHVSTKTYGTLAYMPGKANPALSLIYS